MFKPEALNAFQKAWDDSEYGVQDKQHEESGVVIGESNPNGDLNLIPKAYPRKPDEPVYRLDNFDTWQPELAKSLPQNQKILYFYHAHPFKPGTSYALTTGKIIEITALWQLVQPTAGADNINVLPGSFGVLITPKKLILFDRENKILCSFKYKFEKKRK